MNSKQTNDDDDNNHNNNIKYTTISSFIFNTMNSAYHLNTIRPVLYLANAVKFDYKTPI